MAKKKITFPYTYSKNGRQGKIYKLGNGTFKTHFTFAHKAHQNNFSTLENALASLENEFNRLDSDLGNSESQFPLNRDRKHYWELEQRLKQESDDSSLWQAVDFYLTFHKKKKHTPLSVSECALKFIVSRQANGTSPPQIKTLKKHFRRFERSFGTRKIDTIDAQEIADWLDSCKDEKTGKKWSAKTKKSVRGSLVSLARYARKVLRAIPATGEETEFEKVPRPKVSNPKEVEIYTPDDLKKVLNCAIEYDVDLIPIIVMGAFLGLRPTEAHGEDVEKKKLPWEAFDWEEEMLNLIYQKVRTKRPRSIPIQNAAQKWLAPFRALNGPIWTLKSAYDRRFGNVRKKAGVRAITDGWRHSYASYRIKQLKGNLETLADEMGNSPDEITRSYKRGVPAAESDEWFGILPPAGYAKLIASILKSRKTP